MHRRQKLSLDLNRQQFCDHRAPQELQLFAQAETWFHLHAQLVHSLPLDRTSGTGYFVLFYYTFGACTLGDCVPSSPFILGGGLPFGSNASTVCCHARLGRSAFDKQQRNAPFGIVNLPSEIWPQVLQSGGTAQGPAAGRAERRRAGHLGGGGWAAFSKIL